LGGHITILYHKNRNSAELRWFWGRGVGCHGYRKAACPHPDKAHVWPWRGRVLTLLFGHDRSKQFERNAAGALLFCASGDESTFGTDITYIGSFDPSPIFARHSGRAIVLRAVPGLRPNPRVEGTHRRQGRTKKSLSITTVFLFHLWLS